MQPANRVTEPPIGAYSRACNSILITGMGSDRLNSNSLIRTFAAEGFCELLPAATIRNVPVELAPKTAAEIRPDFILAIGSAAIDGDALSTIRNTADVARCPLALWLHDDPYEFDYAWRAEAIADHIFTNDHWASLHYRHPSVRHLPLGASPSTYFRPPRTQEPPIDVFFCGHAHPNRVQFFRRLQKRLKDLNTVILGTGWPSDLEFAKNGWVHPKQVADYANKSRVILNLPRVYNLANQFFDLPPSTPGPRTFEMALTGAAQLCCNIGPSLADFYTPSVEVLVADTYSEIAGMVGPDAMDANYLGSVATAAQHRTISDHTYVRRAQQIVQGIFENEISTAVNPTSQQLSVAGSPSTRRKRNSK